VGDGTYGGSVTASAAVIPVEFLGDGPAARTVRGRVVDAGGAFTDYTATVNVLNAPPTATLTDDGPVDVGNPLTVAFLNPTDPSPGDVAAGLLYSFDFDNDGTFEVSNSATPSASFVYPAPGTYTVLGRVADKDGGFTDLTRVVTIRTVPP